MIMNLNYLEETIRTSKYLVCLAGMEGIMLEKEAAHDSLFSHSTLHHIPESL